MRMAQKIPQVFYCVVATLLVVPSVFGYVAPVVSRETATMGPDNSYQGGSSATPQAYDDGASDWQGQSDSQPSSQPDSADLLSPVQQNVSRGQQSSADEIESLQQEIRELRGQLEVQAHTLKQMEDAQKKQSLAMEGQLAAAKAQKAAMPKAEVDEEEQTESVPAEDSPVPQKAANEDDSTLSESETYQQAQTLIKHKQYTQAISSLQAYLQRFPKGQYAANAHYWLGELLLIQGNSKGSLTEFSVVINDFPLSPKIPDAMLKLGLIYADQGDWGAARQQLMLIKNKFPGTSPAQLADQRLRQLDVLGH